MPSGGSLSKMGSVTTLTPAQSPMPYKILVNRELCASNAECVSLAPEVFGLDDEELCIVLDPEGAKDKRILLAARGCPVDAITLISDHGEQVWP